LGSIPTLTGLFISHSCDNLRKLLSVATSCHGVVALPNLTVAVGENSEYLQSIAAVVVDSVVVLPRLGWSRADFESHDFSDM
jgi:hypothetical protein